MKDITKEYSLLFNTITDTEEALRLLQRKLVAAQRQAEAMFLEDGKDRLETASKPA